MRADRDYLEDILEAIRRIYSYVAGGKQFFLASEMVQDAVLRNFEVIGEASRNIDETLRNAHPEVPWRQIAAFRNFLIHAYWGVRLERVWQIIETDLPPLKPQMEAILRQLDED